MTRKSALKSRDMVTIPKAEYERLRDIARESEEDVGTARLVTRAKKNIDAGEPLLPKEVIDRVMNGANPVRTLREFRRLTQQELAVAAGIGQGYLSDLENGKRKGGLSLHKKIARELNVPLDLLAAISISDEEADPARYAKIKGNVQPILRQRNRR
jgi:DNA-binding XRE family transcriptional regulator